MINGILLDQATLGDDIDIACLSQLFNHWQSHEGTQADDVVSRCQNAHVIITNKVQLTSQHLRSLPSLKIIAVAATGMNNIDLACAKELNIKVVNVKGYGNSAVAQHTFNLILQLAGRSVQYQQFINQGKWQQSPFFSNLDFPTMELEGKTLGIIGYGGLGQATAKVAFAFGMSVLVSEHKGESNIREGRVSFETLLAKSDIVSLHCPLTENNHQLIDANALSLMKPSALLINTARGPLIDEAALVNALNHQDIGGAALDVLSQEPPVDGNVLLDYQASCKINGEVDNLIITPHLAWAAVEARQRLVEMLAVNISNALVNFK